MLRKAGLVQCFVIFAGLAALLGLAGCGDGVTPSPTNTAAIAPPPTNTAAVASSPTPNITVGELKVAITPPVAPNARVPISILTGLVPAGVKVSYSWDTFGKGEILQGADSDAILYRAPAQAGTYKIQLTIVMDGATVTRSTFVEVVQPTDTPVPEVTSTFTPTATDTPTPTRTPRPLPATPPGVAVTLHRPQDGEEVPCYYTASGTLSRPLNTQQGEELWLFVKPPNTSMVHPEPNMDVNGTDWRVAFQIGACPAEDPGKKAVGQEFTILVGVANKAAVAGIKEYFVLHDKAKGGDGLYPGIPLPAGYEVKTTVKVVRLDQTN